jgi:hypothetical protein
LEEKNLSYIFGINRTGFPEHYYFGTRIGRDDLAYTYEANIGDSGKAHAGGLSSVSAS